MSRETHASESLPPIIDDLAIRPGLRLPRFSRPRAAGSAEGLLARISPYWTLTVVSLFCIAAAIDHGQMPLLVNQIRHDLHLSDMQISLILGFSSTIVTNLLLMPAGYLADRFSRRVIFSLSAVAWSLTAMTSGFVGSFWALFGARSGLAGAEATLQPTGHSMLRDAFPARERGMPFSIFWAAQALGVSVSLFIGGSLLKASEAGAFHGWPIIGTFKPWQLVLAVPGLCTLPLAVLMMTVREPARTHEPPKPAEKESAGAFEFVVHLFKHWPLFWPGLAYSIWWALQAYGVAAWQPTALERAVGIPTWELAKVTGLLGVPATLIGLLVGGWLVDHLGKRGVGDGAIKVCLVFSALAAAFQIAVYYVGSSFLIYACIGIGMFFNGTINSSYYVAVSFVTPGRFMGQMIALQFLCLTVPGAFSPVIVAWLSDLYAHSQGVRSLMTGVKIDLITCSVIYLAFLALWTHRIERFARLHKEGAA